MYCKITEKSQNTHPHPLKKYILLLLSFVLLSSDDSTKNAIATAENQHRTAYNIEAYLSNREAIFYWDRYYFSTYYYPIKNIKVKNSRIAAAAYLRNPHTRPSPELRTEWNFDIQSTPLELFTREILCHRKNKNTNQPLALDANNVQANTEESSLEPVEHRRYSITTKWLSWAIDTVASWQYSKKAGPNGSHHKKVPNSYRTQSSWKRRRPTLPRQRVMTSSASDATGSKFSHHQKL